MKISITDDTHQTTTIQIEEDVNASVFAPKLQYMKRHLTLTVQSLDAVMTRDPSFVKMASFTYDVWPRNSFNNLPFFIPCILH